MTAITHGRIERGRVCETIAPPAWVKGLLGHGGASTCEGGLQVVDAGKFALISASIPEADRLSALDLQHAVCSLYRAIKSAMNSLVAREPVRVWNFIPGIHARMSSDDAFLDRYMVFNAGRFAAYAEWYGEGDIGRRMATATGIGHSGSELVVHCLTSTAPGRAVENPRQVPAYLYSTRRGPIPPAFSRATMVDTLAGQMLLVGGTASVRGERTMFAGDTLEQTLETFHNLASLVAGDSLGDAARPVEPRLRSLLSPYRTLRAYIVNPTDADMVRRLIETYFKGLEMVEVCRADVCRRTLHVEIEGTAIADAGAAS